MDGRIKVSYASELELYYSWKWVDIKLCDFCKRQFELVNGHKYYLGFVRGIRFINWDSLILKPEAPEFFCTKLCEEEWKELY